MRLTSQRIARDSKGRASLMIEAVIDGAYIDEALRLTEGISIDDWMEFEAYLEDRLKVQLEPNGLGDQVGNFIVTGPPKSWEVFDAACADAGTLLVFMQSRGNGYMIQVDVSPKRVNKGPREIRELKRGTEVITDAGPTTLLGWSDAVGTGDRLQLIGFFLDRTWVTRVIDGSFTRSVRGLLDSGRWRITGQRRLPRIQPTFRVPGTADIRGQLRLF